MLLSACCLQARDLADRTAGRVHKHPEIAAEVVVEKDRRKFLANVFVRPNFVLGVPPQHVKLVGDSNPMKTKRAAGTNC